jgi:hypothetical protein
MALSVRCLIQDLTREMCEPWSEQAMQRGSMLILPERHPDRSCCSRVCYRVCSKGFVTICALKSVKCCDVRSVLTLISISRKSKLLRNFWNNS